MIEQAANQISAENTELTCAFIQKTAVEKAIPEMDKRFAEVCCRLIMLGWKSHPLDEQETC